MDALEKIPSIGISLTVELPGKKALVLQSFVERDCEVPALNSVLDKLRIATERQFAFGAIEACKAQLEQEEKLAEQHAHNIAIVDENVKRRWSGSGRRGDPKLSAAEETQQRQAYQNVEESKKRIAKVKKDLAEYQAMTERDGVALNASQIVDLATQIAKCPGFTAQALALLNAALQELAQNYDFNVIRKSHTFTFSTSATGNGYAPGSGPNLMPADFLRLHRNGSFYYISGVPYKLIGVTQEEFDSFVQQAGLASYPYLAYVDVTAVADQEPGLYVWPPASGAYAATIRYNPQMPDIVAQTDVPWFPNTNYLYTRVAGELMKLTNDDRWPAFIGDADPDKDTAGSAASILRGYLRMKDDPETAVKTVALDRRHFRAAFSNLPVTKTVGW